MFKSKKDLIKEEFTSSMCGVSIVKSIELNNTEVVFYKCDNDKFSDKKHIKDCFEWTEQKIKKYMGKETITKVDDKNRNGYTIVKVIIID